MGSVSRCAFRLFCFLVVVRAKPIMTPNNFNLPPNVSLIPPPILEVYVPKTTIAVSEATTRKIGLVEVRTTQVPETTATTSTLPTSTSTELLEATITVLSTTENSTSTSTSTNTVTGVESTTPPTSTPIDSTISTTTTTFPFSLRAVSPETSIPEEVTASPCEFETDVSQPSTR